MSSKVFLRIGFPILLVLVFLLLSPLHTTTQAQIESNDCALVLSEQMNVELDPIWGATSSGSDQLPAGEIVAYVGQTPDGEYWILRYEDQYVLYSTTNPDLRPEGCEVSLWGPPQPDYRPLDEIMTEVGIDAWHEAGYLGQGVRVGVLDTRFDGLSDFLSDTSLESSQFTFLPSLEALGVVDPAAESTSPYHGTNVLEVLTTIAPQSEYVVAKAVNADQFQQAVDDLIAADVHIIVHAGNVITPDPSPYHDAVRRATDADILWINSAGNIGAGFYPGQFSGGSGLLPLHQFEDPNRAGLQQGLMVPVNRDGPVSVTVVWEDGRTEQIVNDFELVVSGNCRLDATETFQPLSSDNNQTTGEAEPSERVRLTSGDLVMIASKLALLRF